MTSASEAPELLLQHHLKRLRLPTVLREYEKLARQCAAENVDHIRYLSRLIELELIDREARMVERRIKAAKFPAIKSLETFDFDAIPTLNKKLVLDLARSEFVDRRENVIALGPSGVGKTHVAIALGVAACQRGVKTRFTTAAAIVHELIEARDEKRLLRLQKQLASHELLIIDELGFVPLSRTGAELLFELISQRYERGATIITSNLPFDEWTATFGEERLTGALLDRLWTTTFTSGNERPVLPPRAKSLQAQTLIPKNAKCKKGPDRGPSYIHRQWLVCAPTYWQVFRPILTFPAFGPAIWMPRLAQLMRTKLSGISVLATTFKAAAA